MERPPAGLSHSVLRPGEGLQPASGGSRLGAKGSAPSTARHPATLRIRFPAAAAAVGSGSHVGEIESDEDNAAQRLHGSGGIDAAMGGSASGLGATGDTVTLDETDFSLLDTLPVIKMGGGDSSSEVSSAAPSATQSPAHSPARSATASPASSQTFSHAAGSRLSSATQSVSSLHAAAAPVAADSPRQRPATAAAPVPSAPGGAGGSRVRDSAYSGVSSAVLDDLLSSGDLNASLGSDAPVLAPRALASARQVPGGSHGGEQLPWLAARPSAPSPTSSAGGSSRQGGAPGGGGAGRMSDSLLADDLLNSDDLKVRLCGSRVDQRVPRMPLAVQFQVSAVPHLLDTEACRMPNCLPGADWTDG